MVGSEHDEMVRRRGGHRGAEGCASQFRYQCIHNESFGASLEQLLGLHSK